MSDEELNIAIAEALGWTVIGGCLCDPKPEVKSGVETGEVELNPVANLPNYCTDLNACHEVEKGLTDKQHAYFRSQLSYAAKQSAGIVMTEKEFREWFSASARHRALALLKTLSS